VHQDLFSLKSDGERRFVGWVPPVILHDGHYGEIQFMIGVKMSRQVLMVA
jgi:hypothetical protein